MAEPPMPEDPKSFIRLDCTQWKECFDFLFDPNHTPDAPDAPPAPICSICEVNEISIHGIPTGYTEATPVEGLYTFCGHLFCRICYRHWYEHCYMQRNRLTCPVCREDLHFADDACNHELPVYILSMNKDIPLAPGEFIAERTPLTEEHGAARPSKCWTCMWSIGGKEKMGWKKETAEEAIKRIREARKSQKEGSEVETFPFTVWSDPQLGFRSPTLPDSAEASHAGGGMSLEEPDVAAAAYNTANVDDAEDDDTGSTPDAEEAMPRAPPTPSHQHHPRTTRAAPATPAARL
ncbi:hypothetical protein QBC38DRAFT_182717 [Podospora fimiseda]|uniref:RING-type domain-containing protein n=1 Tax=Podospora fimiseda TaxID=252190 RepID=A0AAN6YMA2_9PEZI|nr:hypothetical protein QBC38DRAFT_182717 [Podospora fimiseda]